MNEDGLATDLIDVSGLTLDDVAGLPDTALAVALREALGGGAAAGTSAGFSSRLRRDG